MVAWLEWSWSIEPGAGKLATAAAATERKGRSQKKWRRRRIWQAHSMCNT